MSGAWRAFPTRLPACRQHNLLEHFYHTSSFKHKHIQNLEESKRRATLTSVISKMLSGSRLPPPTFLVQVIVPLCVTDMIRLATEQAFSCRVASTTCLWPTCRKTVNVTVCVMMVFKNVFLLSISRVAHLAQRHDARNVFYIESHAIIRVV